MKQPLNPILGETFYTKTATGAQLWCEQTSHHPPISHFRMLGPESNPFDFYGHVQVQVKVKGLFSSVHISAPGSIWLKTAVGHIYFYECTNYDIEGIMGSDKVLMAVGNVRVFDLSAKLVAVINFDAEKNARYGYISSFIMGTGDRIDPLTGVSPHRKDLVRIDIHELLIDDENDPNFKAPEKQGPLVARGHGSYLEKIQYEGEERTTWTINDKVTLKTTFAEVDGSLKAPSDSTFRADLIHLLAEEYEQAEHAKH